MRLILPIGHVLADVEQLADRVAILVEGKLVALEAITALREHLMLGSQMRVELLNSSEGLIAVAQNGGASEVTVQGNAYCLRLRRKRGWRFWRALKTLAARLCAGLRKSQALEDVYLKYIRKEV